MALNGGVRLEKSRGEIMKRSILIPISFITAAIVIGLVMAKTELFQPLIQFIHSDTISLLQAAGCLVAAVAGFYVCLKVLIILGNYFLPAKEE